MAVIQKDKSDCPAECEAPSWAESTFCLVVNSVWKDSWRYSVIGRAFHFLDISSLEKGTAEVRPESAPGRSDEREGEVPARVNSKRGWFRATIHEESLCERVRWKIVKINS
jgi:hypothetical protein